MTTQNADSDPREMMIFKMIVIIDEYDKKTREFADELTAEVNRIVGTGVTGAELYSAQRDALRRYDSACVTAHAEYVAARDSINAKYATEREN